MKLKPTWDETFSKKDQKQLKRLAKEMLTDSRKGSHLIEEIQLQIKENKANGS